MAGENARAKTFNIRFSDEEWRRLDRVAEHYALTAAGVIRMLLKREVDAIARASASNVSTRVERSRVTPKRRTR